MTALKAKHGQIKPALERMAVVDYEWLGEYFRTNTGRFAGGAGQLVEQMTTYFAHNDRDGKKFKLLEKAFEVHQNRTPHTTGYSMPGSRFGRGGM